MSVLFAIILLGLGTYACRAIFIVGFAHAKFPPLALRVLDYVAPAVMGSLVVSLLINADGNVQLHWPEAVGLLVAAAVVWKTRNHFYALVAAMTAYWLVSAGVSHL